MEGSKNRITVTGILVASILIVGMFAITGQIAASPGTLVVDDDTSATPSDCDAAGIAAPSIAAAIIPATDGDIIIVCPGTYGEISVGERLRIYGYPGAKIMGTGVGPAVLISSVNTGCLFSDRTVIDGFEITGGTNGITVSLSCRVFIQRNDIHDNSVRGILFGGTDHSWIDNNKIHNNGDGVAGEDDGIEVGENSNDNFIAHNMIFNHVGHGIEIFESFTSPTSIRNLITQNKLTNNDGWGVCLCGPVGGSSNTVRGNLATDNGVSASTGGGYLIKGSSNLIIKNLSKLNLGNGYEVDPAVLGNGANTLTRNTADHNGGKGFRDLSVGSGTGGTANTYVVTPVTNKNKCIMDETNVAALVPSLVGCIFAP